MLFFPKGSLNLYMQKNTIHREDTKLFSSLSNTLVYNQERLEELITTPFCLGAFKKQIFAKQNSFTQQQRDILVAVLNQQYSDLAMDSLVYQHIQSLKQTNTFTIVTGHQLNLFTGPAYVIYKILHIINLCESLKQQYPENNFVPVFWMATEDHDIEEINNTKLFGKAIVWEQNEGGPVGRYSLENWSEIQEVLKKFFQNNEQAEINQLIDSYQGNTLAEATKNLFHTLFEKYGLVILDQDDAKLKKQFTPVFKQEIENSFVENAVLQANAKIEQMGFKPQAFVRPINIFYIEKGIRNRLKINDNQIEIDGVGSFTKDEILAKLEQNPASFSPNVMMRPLYQEYSLPNLTYVGGGGEISYWIQQKGIFDAIDLPFPLIQVRNSVEVIDPTNAKKWNKLGLYVDDLFASTQELQKLYIDKHDTDKLDFSVLETLANQLTEYLQNQIVSVDASLDKFAEAEVSKLQKQLDAIKGKLIKQKKGQFEVAFKQIEEVKAKLFPNQGLQERTDSFFTFCKDGNYSVLIDQFKQAMDPFEKDLILLYL
jgi:bacillithiol biosynthesis cysteine-adding enzyme BshC